MRVTGIIALALLAGPALTAPLPPKPVYREVRDFVVACDNLRSCVVRWAPDYGAGGYLRITRDGGPGGQLEIALAESEAALPERRTLTLDGRPFARDLPWRKGGDAAELVVAGADALGVARGLSEGTTLTYAAGGGTLEVTLSGLKAALLLVDETQGRLGTAGAFVRTGPADDATVPPAPPLPVIVSRPVDPKLVAPPGFAARVRRAQSGVLARNDCDDERRDMDEAHPLNRDEVLVLLGCMMHAYQSSMILLRAPRDAPERAKLVVMPLAAGDAPVSPEDAGRYVEGGWDPETATFSEAAKGRGLADCGSSTTWAFDGSAFRLAEAQRLNRCPGGPPGDWPTVFRSKVEPRRQP